MGAGDVLQIDGALRGIHAVVIKMDTELQIGDGERRQAEMAFAGIAFGSGENRVGAFRRIMDFGSLPVGEKEGIVLSHRAELRGAEDVGAICTANDIGVEEAAWHFAFEKDVVGVWRDDNLCADRATIVCFNRWRCDTVTVGAVWETDSPATAFCAEIDGALDGLRIVGDAVCFGAEIHDIESK